MVHGFETATPIQGQAIPHAIKGKDILGIAQTGTGKTAAFLLLTMDRIMDTPNDEKVKALIVVPTRELAIQIDQAAQGFAYYTASRPCHLWEARARNLPKKKGPDRGCRHHHCHTWTHAVPPDAGYVDLSSLEVLILDEADRMLDMGFHQDIMRTRSIVVRNARRCCSPPQCQTACGPSRMTCSMTQ